VSTVPVQYDNDATQHVTHYVMLIKHGTVFHHKCTYSAKTNIKFPFFRTLQNVF